MLGLRRDLSVGVSGSQGSVEMVDLTPSACLELGVLGPGWPEGHPRLRLVRSPRRRRLRIFAAFNTARFVKMSRCSGTPSSERSMSDSIEGEGDAMATPTGPGRPGQSS